MEEKKIVVNPKLEKFWNFVLKYKLIGFGLFGLFIALQSTNTKSETIIGSVAMFTILLGILKVFCNSQIREQAIALIGLGLLVLYYNVEKTYTERVPVGEAFAGLMIFVGAIWQSMELLDPIDIELEA